MCREDKCQYYDVNGHVAKIYWWLLKKATTQSDIPQALAALMLDNIVANIE